MDEPDPPRATLGHRLLREYLCSTGQSIYALCQKNESLDRITMQRIVKGERGQRMPVTLAVEIERATDGAVPVASWAQAAADPLSLNDPDDDSTDPAVAVGIAREVQRRVATGTDGR